MNNKVQVFVRMSVVALGLCMMCGCMRTLSAVQNTRGEGPLMNEVVSNRAQDGFKVFQVCDDGRIMVDHNGWQHYQINEHTGVRADTYSESFLDLRVQPLVSDYVDEQPLRTGLYKYVGVYEYQTVEKKKRRIRDFIEVPAGSR